MNSRVSALVALLAASCFLPEGSSQSLGRRVSSFTEVRGFSWQNCGAQDDPAKMKSLSVSPDPISIPGLLTAAASGSTSVALTSPVSVNVTLEREIAGLWVKIPCLDEIGSCHYPNGCDLLDQLIPPGQDCPEPLHTYGLPCHCPFKAGDYALPSTDIIIPDVELPGWLTNGNYRVRSVLGSSEKELGCLKISFSLHSSRKKENDVIVQ